jgi:uncharacterized protein (TIGR02466 family)
MSDITEHPIFITSCYTTYLENVNNTLLIETIKQLEKSNPSNTRSNKGGWQSVPRESKDVDNLVTLELFNNVIMPMAQKIMNVWSLPIELSKYSYWYNINKRYNYNSAHPHPNSYISGVYYIKVPSNSGRIMFDRSQTESDRMFFQTQYLLNNSIDVDNPRINTEHWFAPQEGMLLMFPGHLMHSVEQNLSTDDDDSRISLSFNFT